jgi:hypothetical protein
MLTGLFWWGVLVAVIFALARCAVTGKKRTKSEIIKNVNQHLYGKLTYNRRSDDQFRR